MVPHPDFASLDMPQSLCLGVYHLDVLTAEDVTEDFDAVMRSKSVLQGIFDPIWPEGLTLEDNLTDLHWHYREFTAKRSYAWVIRDDAGTYLGCAYLSPDMGGRGTGYATYWMADGQERIAHLKAFGQLYKVWLTKLLPPPFSIKFKSNIDL